MSLKIKIKEVSILQPQYDSHTNWREGGGKGGEERHWI